MKDYRDFIPKDDPGLALWAHNYKNSFPELIDSLPDIVSEEVVVEQQKLAQEIMDALQSVERLKAELAGAIAHKDRIRAENTQEIRAMAVKIKRSMNYSPEMGARLNIVYKRQIRDSNSIASDVRVVAEKDFVNIHFTKRGALGAAIFSRYEDGEWEMLGKQATSPFIDKRPLRISNQPERREYMVRLWSGTEFIGQESNVVSTVAGV